MPIEYKHAYTTSYAAPLVEKDDFAEWLKMLVDLYDAPDRVPRESPFVQDVFKVFSARIDSMQIPVDRSVKFLETARHDATILECVEDLRLEEPVLMLWENLRDPKDRGRAHDALRRVVEDFATRSAKCDMPTGDASVDAGALGRLRQIITEAFEGPHFGFANEIFGEWRVENKLLWLNLRDRFFYERINPRDLALCDRESILEVIDGLRNELFAENRRGRKPDPAADKFAREMIDIWIELTGKSWTHDLKAEQASNAFLKMLEAAGKIVDSEFNARTRAENARKQMPKWRKQRSRP